MTEQDLKELVARAQAKFEDGKWFARWTVNDAWVEIPAHKVDTTRDSPDGRSHMCGRHNRFSSHIFDVFCFVPGVEG